MTRWERIKHRLGVHDINAEWLDGRIFEGGRFQRTYYCPQCDRIFHTGNVYWETRQERLSLSQLRVERDEGRRSMQRLLLEKPYKEQPTETAPFSAEELQQKMNDIHTWLNEHS